ncbi:MAG: acyl carrier protein [candidate division Zixibacteria bacterium]|nr:acyl carrier protein [candidate division Zixibacteria bacterium]
MDVDWHLWVAHRPGARISARFAPVLSASTNGHTSRLLSCLKEMSAEERPVYLQNWLSQEAARVLRMPEDRLEPHRSLMEQGMDSLFAAEMISGLRTETLVEFSQMDLIKHPSIKQLSALLCERLEQEQQAH